MLIPDVWQSAASLSPAACSPAAKPCERPRARSSPPPAKPRRRRPPASMCSATSRPASTLEKPTTVSIGSVVMSQVSMIGTCRPTSNRRRSGVGHQADHDQRFRLTAGQCAQQVALAGFRIAEISEQQLQPGRTDRVRDAPAPSRRKSSWRSSAPASPRSRCGARPGRWPPGSGCSRAHRWPPPPRARVAGATLSGERSTRDTVIAEVPACAATSSIRGFPIRLGSLADRIDVKA